MTYIIGIAGGSGSGKTTFSNRLLTEFGSHMSILRQDNYYKPTDNLSVTERQHRNYDHPDAIDFSLFLQQVHSLSSGESIESPVYDFITHTRTANTQPVPAKSVLIVEGIFVLYEPKLRNLFDLKIFVEADADERFLRRALRDMNERGRRLPDIAEQYLTYVKPMHNRFVEPTKSFADIIINNPFNDTAYSLVSNQIHSVINR